MKSSCLGAGMVALLLAAIAGCGLVKQLGKNPGGEELARLDTLPNYKNGSFQNLVKRPDSTIKHNRLFTMFHGHRGPVRPSSALPWVKTDLKTPASTVPTVVWFGHS